MVRKFSYLIMFGLFFMAFFAGTARNARAQDDAAAREEAAPDGTPAFKARLEALGAFLADRTSYRVLAKETWAATDGNGAEEGENAYELAVSRPGRFLIRIQSPDRDEPTLVVACADEDAEVLGLYRGEDGPLLQRSPRLGAIEGLRRNPFLAQSLSGSFLDVLVRPDLADYVLDSTTAVVDLGSVDLDGDSCRHIQGQWADGRTIEFWFAEEGPPVLQQLRRTRTTPGSTPEEPFFRLVSTVAFKWEPEPELAASLFEVAVPDGTREVDDLYAAVTGAGESLKLGAKPPELNLPLLGGGRLRLADHEGLDHVVLNFWATWYPTGVESLPTVAEFAREYEPRGIVFYHVNMAEPADSVEAFLKTLEFPMVVALDSEGTAMELYSVRSLPFSVIIGKDGTIQAVNAGEVREFRQRFRAQLDALLEGKALEPTP